MTLPAERFASDDPVSDADMTTYYEANRAKFATPEQVKVEYLVLDAEHLPGVAAPSEDKLREVYTAQPERFGQPERRRARHILVSVPAGADAAADAQAKAAIESARERIEKGEDFAAVASEVSQDPAYQGPGRGPGGVRPGGDGPRIRAGRLFPRQGAASASPCAAVLATT